MLSKSGSRNHRCLEMLTLSLLLSIGAGPALADTPFLPPKIHVPEGFVVEVAAAPPLVKHPMMAGFDPRGRLFVAESAGRNMRSDELEAELPNFIRMLEDRDGDGVFDRSTIFADHMTLPMGALWHDGALYVAAPPSLWRLKDTDDDGVADQRTQIVTRFGYNGNAASIHGPFLGPCGRLYWCDGRHGHEFRDGRGRPISQGKAARIFSCQPDGSDVQVHCGGGMDNPVEVDFTRRGEMLGTVNLLYRRRGDCLVHWQRGGVYPRLDQPECLAEFQQTGGLLGPVYDLGHVAVSGTTIYRGRHLGESMRDNVMVAEFNTHAVSRLVLKRQGSSFTAEKTLWLTCDSIDFHPTDVLEDADGSLLVIDTGGWFRIGCPTSKVAKPQIPGAIYRVGRAEGPVVRDPRGEELPWEVGARQLALRLADDRAAVRERATAELARLGDAAVPPVSALLSHRDADARAAAVWTLSRVGTESARKSLRTALSDGEAPVRQAAVHSLGTLRDQASVPALVEIVTGAEPALRRAAAEALGQIGSANATPALLTALAAAEDRPLEHALIYALIEIDAAQETRPGLASASIEIRRGALIALDQMPSGRLTRDEVAAQLDTSDVHLQQTALEIIGRHADWSEQILSLAKKWLAIERLDAQRRGTLRGVLIALEKKPHVQQLIGAHLGSDQVAKSSRLLLLEVIAQSRLREFPEAWLPGLKGALASGSPKIVPAALAATAQHQHDRWLPALRDIAGETTHAPEVRTEALRQLSQAGEALEPAAFDYLIEQAQEAPPLDRLAAVDAIASAPLTSAQLLALAPLLKQAGPIELPGLLASAAKSKETRIGLHLADALAGNDAATTLPPARLLAAFAAYDDRVKNRIEELAKRAGHSAAGEAEKMERYSAALEGGDVASGRKVFFSRRAGCYACHRVAGEGGTVGPDLSTIGKIRSGRDLLEALLLPSASLARGYESFRIITKDGKTHAGLIIGRGPEQLALLTDGRRELRIARDRIDLMTASGVSIMPTGLEKTMTETELRDLIAYLASLKE